MVIATRSRNAARRRGALTPLLVLFGLVIIAVLVASQQYAFHSHQRQELQNAADAAAHAAARTLVTERVFTTDFLNEDPAQARNDLVAAAQAAGTRFAGVNHVAGHLLTLQPNPDNQTTDQGGELYVGTLSDPLSRNFITDPRTGFDPNHPDLNAVRVVLFRNGAAASVTYFVDRDVVGFRTTLPSNPLAANALPPAIPMVPAALPAALWDDQIVARNGPDVWQMSTNPPPNTPSLPVSGSDGIPELTVTVGGNAPLLRLDPSNTFDTTLAQVQNGVAAADLPATNGVFRLNPLASQAANANVALVPVQPVPVSPTDRGGDLATALAGWNGQPRVWVLYSDVQTDTTTGNQTATVVGFVVARVMTARAAGPGQATVTLQPSVLVTATALTDATLRDVGPRSLYNPYVARVRLLE